MMRFSALAAFAGITSSTEVFVMLPLDTVTSEGALKDKSGLEGKLDQLKSASVDGFMADCWWGVTERTAKSYDFSAYQELASMAKSRGMKMQIVASFHQCGGNVGDACSIPVPSFVRNAANLWYKDQQGNEDYEYVSLFADSVKVGDRTPLEMYSDWFAAFAKAFSSDLGSTIVDVQVGMGPAGELRYPAYQLAHWNFCGIGAFQAFDDNALASFKAAAAAAGHAEWNSPPTDAGDYNSRAEQTSFFQNGYQSEYGKFFLNWYFESLKTHGKNVLSSARKNLGSKIGIAGKVAGIHWWYKSTHHAAELTAGYYNTNNRDAYAEIAEVFKSNANAMVDFTCMEMEDNQQPVECGSGPEELVQQVFRAGASKGVITNGENALPRYDDEAYRKIESYKGSLHSFTYLRLNPNLLNGDNFNKFKGFVGQMHNGEANATIVI